MLFRYEPSYCYFSFLLLVARFQASIALLPSFLMIPSFWDNLFNAWLLTYISILGQPSEQPTEQPSMQPSEQPTSRPSRQPTSQPSRQPTEQPTSQPSRDPTNQPTSQPSEQPSSKPSRQPTEQPSGTVVNSLLFRPFLVFTSCWPTHFSFRSPLIYSKVIYRWFIL